MKERSSHVSDNQDYHKRLPSPRLPLGTTMALCSDSYQGRLPWANVLLLTPARILFLKNKTLYLISLKRHR